MLGVALSRPRCVSLGESLTSLSLSFLMSNTCVTLLMDVLLGLGDQGGSLGIKTTEFPQKQN